MATTRIMPLHVGKGRTESRAISDIIDYVANPKKTDNGRLITGYACDSRTADAEFLLAKRQYIAATGRVRGTDDATWAKFADYASGIISLPGTPVYWRNAEDKNISNSTRFDGEKLKATGLFLKWIGMNYRLNLRESRFQDALVTYVNVILECSVRGNYSLKDLVCLYAIMRKFSPTVASRILRSHILKAKLFI